MNKSLGRKSRRKLQTKLHKHFSQKNLRKEKASQQKDAELLGKTLDYGIEHHQSGRLAEAEACYQQVLQWQPDQADAWHLLGVIAYQREQYSTAIERIGRALRLNETVASFHNSLGSVCAKLLEFDHALECYQRAIRLTPDYFQTHNNIGLVYQKQGRLDKAVDCYLQAIKLNTDFAESYLNLSIAYEKQTQLDKAYTCCRKAIQIQSNYADAHCQLGKLLSKQAKSKEATESYRRALRINPSHVVAQHDLMLNLLYYSGDHDPSMIAAEHQHYAERHAKPLEAAIQPHSNDRNPERHLRIGYISGDFKTHSVAYFFEPLLTAHNSSDFEVICYANNEKGDATTERLKLSAASWREIHALSDEQVAERVREDGIDILVDLSGHTEGNRLLVFARKPAPVQISYIGYPCTTGLETMDYRLTDTWADPEGQTDHLYTEKLFRLPHGFLCYKPSGDCPDVGPPPVLQVKHVTFGSFNKLAKVNPELIGHWAKILKAVPGSRLIIKSKPLVDSDTCAYIQELFQQHEIDAERLELLGWLPDKTQHLGLYAKVDIAMDTFPYNGTTTTCEAMWMGVPVITQAGQAHVSRVGVSLLSSVGLEELIAESAEDYVQKAIDLAKNVERLQELRTNLRPRMQTAPLTNAGLIARSLEDAYRTMWRGFCGQSPVAVEKPVFAQQADPVKIQQQINLGIQHHQSGQLQEAETCYKQVVQWQPNDADALHLLGVIAAQQGQYQTAIEKISHAIELKPGAATFYSNLGNAYQESGKLKEAVQSLQKALQLQPDHPQACNNLAVVLQHQGKLKEAIPFYKKALKIKPDYAEAHSNLLGGFQYSDYEPSAIFAEHQQWAERHAKPLVAAIQAHDNDCNPGRCLRIGYVSGDFWNHSVAYFLEPLLVAHNRGDFEVICYANNEKSDATTERLKQRADGWREIHALSDEQVAEQVRQDGIDILVDLSGHTQGNRLLVFARKPAPVQVSYLGYPSTTGLETMDYRLTDVWADPEGLTEHLHTEQLIRLPHGFLCYQPSADCPEVSPPPVLETSHVTFGSFNNLAKVNPELIGCWAEILKAVPESRLIIKFKPLADPDTRAYIQGQFQQHGIAPERLELIGWLPDKNRHLALYAHVDIALDTFPYHGTTTTCEAMWMGVPVITHAGQAHVSRVGVSLLSSVGLEELIAESAEDYIQKAVDLANNAERLQELRASLRPRMQNAPLTNASLIAESVENAYRNMWHSYCDLSNAEDKQPRKTRKLHIGGKVRVPGWEVLNALPGSYVDHLGNANDLSQFPDDTFAAIYASHLVEHLDYVKELSATLKDWCRVLVPGGKVYISVPDLDVLARLFLDKKQLTSKDRFQVMRMMFGGHVSPYDYHQVGLNWEFMSDYLQETGFTQICQVENFCLFNDTSKGKFKGVPISLNVIAQKPIQTHSEVPQKIDYTRIKKQFDSGVEHHQAGRLTKAEACYKQVLQWQPNDADALHLLGVIAAQQGQYQTAIVNIKRAIELKPGVAIFYSNLGNAYHESGQLHQAIKCYEIAIQLQPDHADAYRNLGIVFKKQRQLEKAVQAYKQVLQFQPNHPQACNSLAVVLQSQGKLKEAIPFYQRALKIKPDYALVHSNLLFSLHYSDYEPSAIYAEHRQWAERHAKPLAAAIQAHYNDRNPERRLRIGYVSGDFWNHSVAHFLEPLLAAHSRTDFEVICYTNSKKVDATTKRLRQLADGWREIHALDDEQVVELVRQDRIDILVDLSGHTKSNRMLVFARKPAPMQVTYIGYPSTTGLTTMDYRLTDVWADPEGQTEHLHTEQLLRLPHGFLCYQPPLDCPEVNPSPVLKTRQITFGSFNNLAKVNPELIGCWTEILEAVPNSRLIIKSKPLTDTDTCDYVHRLFQHKGIEADRVELLGWLPDKTQHLALYSQVDIALDTFPYNGTTTTCEAMWMGVPVITRAGETHVSRVGVSLLSSVGLEELIAESAEDYVQKAIELANNNEGLQELRANLRPRMQSAPLTNAELIARSVEDAYRTMWRRFCATSVYGDNSSTSSSKIPGGDTPR